MYDVDRLHVYTEYINTRW